ncbi:hypothetical protein [Helicobacter sp. 23-1045]
MRIAESNVGFCEILRNLGDSQNLVRFFVIARFDNAKSWQS